MWRRMGECHRIQKLAIDDAKLIILSTSFPFPFPTAKQHYSSSSSPPKPPPSATNLESELRHWRFAFATWTSAIRSYALSLAAWAHRCSGPANEDEDYDDDDVDVCRRWAGLMESLGEGAQVMDGLDFFAAGIGSVYRPFGVEGKQEEEEKEEAEQQQRKKTAELAGRVLCAGMSVAVGNLTDFAVKSAEGYEGLLLLLEGRDRGGIRGIRGRRT